MEQETIKAPPFSPAGIPALRAAREATSGRIDEVEWPTLSLCSVIYLLWLGVTVWHAALPSWALVVLGGLVAGWHASFQHEVTHGHPTRNETLNAVLAAPSLLLWLPFRLFRREHLRHHAVDALTDPIDDPESFYVLERDWRLMNPVRRGLLIVNNTLAGRLLIGPALVICGVLWRQAWRVGSGDKEAVLDWLSHLPGLVVILGWLVLVVEMPLWLYVLCFSYPGTALLLLRSFHEHRPDSRQSRRTVIVEAGPVFSALFLNNNLHALHHAQPALPWYRLPAIYKDSRSGVLASNGGFVFTGYLEIAGRYLFRAKDHPLHPLRRD
jgi:fatty acid desaturase